MTRAAAVMTPLVPRSEGRIAISHLDGELAAEHEEELVGVRVRVPGELALDLHDPDVVVVDLGNSLRRPLLSEARRHRVDIHRFHVSIVTQPLPGSRTAKDSGYPAVVARC